MKTTEIRRKFLDFFASKGHTEVASSSLVPHNDPTLLFTNAGMNQFKDLFLGLEKRDYVRATTSQRCVRAGGKHNDLENVGFTARHHTFFEMLGNFSFGDYFKKEAINFAWELLTKVYGFPAEKLTVTVFHNDDEAYDIWKDEIGVPAERIIRIGLKEDGSSDNFWQMGDTGPCGPCSEIFYDHGEHIWGGPPGSPEEDGDRFIEIWNLVFMQFNRDEAGVLHPLPKPSVDTGMGLERLSAVLQHVNDNYDIDLFQTLIKAAAAATGCTDLKHNSLKVISDHIRSVAFLIADGVLPSNEGRGYVLRRIIRRAVRHGYKLGQKGLFFHTLAKTLADVMGDAYPELIEKQAHIEAAIKQEEMRFAETLENGLKLLEADIKALNGATTISGETIFKLYDTYGFPVDLTNDIAREQQLALDMDGFEACMEEQRARARAANQFSAEKTVAIDLSKPVEFVGYTENHLDTVILELAKDGELVDTLSEGDHGIVVLERTPFYAESGGQVGDHGAISIGENLFIVEDTKKQGDAILHFGHMSRGSLTKAATVHAKIDESYRNDIRKNHSATHLLHHALQAVLGEHVEQKGSMVTFNRLRFDFSHNAAIPLDVLQAIESHVNAAIIANEAVAIEVMPIDDAKAKGAMALFGEKYGDNVRVVEMGHSIELCGGTHVARTGDIGQFKILYETGIASGVRRIEATTGLHALAITQESERLIATLSELFKSTPEQLVTKSEQTLADLKASDKALQQAKSKLALASSGELLANADVINDVKVIIAHVPDVETKMLRELADKLRDQSQGIVLLGSAVDGKATLVAAIEKSLTAKVKAGDFVNVAAAIVGGKGGGRPDSATAGGQHGDKVDEALATASTWIKAQL
ncbi:alanine--tRNA ligase [Wohlfahrtiimonas chitiniclastica]|uniref:alanine--tRNA ligase n=1 Tax=Wohlfahrtiimonas chitiniclastica TaxID=400946 RepID=UPI001BCC68C0|nr:alanine--tRNA ligase [Wohlfahrtiimonas chitiniclastica]MBS7816540.1 alanine--tRNA ligase [Wohlfahrtiimonas chitiniclastica]MBS7822543.1 alanine--tRNA ligase [Wohlfahrtiimonas chitiniclastica]MBS7830106.1 alanine--tRNA ligase [Wohlfahrtiimonas chitiniclastica]MBS7832102.1 alanine--tRNA ligase [Wohlfahrtiimonas chitiniclastica]